MAKPNVYEESARRVKAQRIVGHLTSRSITSDTLSKMHPNLVAHHLMAAGVSGASEETLGVVHQMLQQHEKDKSRQAVDPFLGLT